MSYEDAPATKMLATQCAVCARPLVDSISVEIGMGPDCRKKHGYDVTGIEPEARISANKIINAIACGDEGRYGTDLAALVNTLRHLGFDKLADVLIERKAAVRIVGPEMGKLSVYSRYNESFIDALRRIPGRRWDKERKVNTVPACEKPALWEAIRRVFPGELGHGCNGPFIIPAA